jgi:hypothetical protein
MVDEKFSSPRLAARNVCEPCTPLPDTPSVPNLLGIPEAECFAAIPRGLVGVMTINATVRGLTLLP